jgi:NADH-quinone oxidoreductase subunit G
VLPGAAYTEKDATYVNLEGRVQRTKRAVFAPGQAKEDWTIIRALSTALHKTLPYDNIDALRARMVAVAPHFAKIGEVVPAAWPAPIGHEDKFRIAERPFNQVVPNFYMTDPICRASKTMAECTQTLLDPLMKRVA